MRTVKPRTAPTTLAELVLDLDDRSDGDEAGDLLIPAEEWRVLLDRAQVEVERPEAWCNECGDTGVSKSTGKPCNAPSPRQKAAKKPKQKGWTCDGCGYQHQGHPSRCADCGKVYPGDLDGDGQPVEDAPAPAMSREQAMSMRMADKKRQRAAAKARKDGSPSVCHRCAATISEDTGGLGMEKEGQQGWTLADGVYCFTCASFVRANAPELPLGTEEAKPKRKRMPIVDAPAVAAPEVTP